MSADALRDRIREIADDILGLQPADADCIDLLDAIEKAYHRERIALAALEAKYQERLDDVMALEAELARDGEP